MKKMIFAAMIACLLMSFSAVSVMASDSTNETAQSELNNNVARASKYIVMYDAYVSAKGNGKVYVYADMFTMYSGSLNLSIVLQVKNNNSWQQVTSWNQSANSDLVYFSSTYSGTAGKEYRIVVNYSATVNGYNETRQMTSSTVTAY